jgi:glycyl-tRNA synthetase beta chain
MNSLLLEIRTEEIPAGYIQPALNALSATLLNKMTGARIDYGAARIFGTPRRLAVIVKDVAAKQKPLKTELIGPPAKVGFDEHGNFSVAAKKFAEKAGIPVSRLTVKDTEKGAYICAQKIERGTAARKLLKEMLPDVILSTPFPKTMRWADLEIAFARPIHSILALLGRDVIPFALGNLKSGRYTYGHSFMHPDKIKISSADDYITDLGNVAVLVDMQARKKLVQNEITKAAKQAGGSILADDELVDIVNNLVEYPIAVAGKFDKEFLEIPDEVLINAMREHQKYFAVVNKKKKLMPYFIAVNNTVAKDMALVAKGHERVLRARLADAQFFYRSDLEISNEDRVEKLKGVLFQADLGTMYAKAERIGKIAGYMVGKVEAGLDGNAQGKELKTQVARAARLCKSDLVSQVVVEFPKLQGIMGRVYATISGELPTVAAAIEEHYRPIYSGAPLPDTLVGAILSIADKMDSICGCFNVGLTPTGASDPYALRRQGIGIVQIMNDKGFSFSLRELIKKSISLFTGKDTGKLEELTEKVYVFLQNRISHLLTEEGFSKDVIAAIVSVSIDNVPNVWHRAGALQTLRTEPDFKPLAIAFKRVVNIIKKSGELEKTRGLRDVNETRFEDNSECALFAAFKKVEEEVSEAIRREFFDQALRDIASLRDPVDAFFEAVMVMTDNTEVRQNRLALLGHIAALFEKIADFSKISA